MDKGTVARLSPTSATYQTNQVINLGYQSSGVRFDFFVDFTSVSLVNSAELKSFWGIGKSTSCMVVQYIMVILAICK